MPKVCPGSPENSWPSWRTGKKHPGEKLFDGIILALPILTGILALMEYLLLPSIHDNPMPYLYSGLLILFLACYTLALFVGIPLHRQGRKKSAALSAL